MSTPLPKFESNEAICKIVNGNATELWENGWVSNKDVKKAMNVSKIVIAPAEDSDEVVQPDEVELFKQNAWAY